MNIFFDKFLIKIVIVISFLIYGNNLEAASFDCGKASSNVEKIICSSEVISKLDEDLSKVYKFSLENAKDADYLKKEQVDWLVFRRNECKDAVCVEKAYLKRIDNLKKVSTICSGGKFIDLVLRKKDFTGAKKMISDDQCNSYYLPYAISSNNTEFFFFILGFLKGYPSGEAVISAAQANPEILAAVVKKGGDVNYVNKYNGYYPLLNAVKNNNISEEKILENVKLLLSHGANINHIDKFGESALRHAVTRNYVTVARYLLEMGADPVQFDPDEEQDGFTVIMQAVKYYESHKDSRIVKELLARGVDPNSHDESIYSYDCDMKNINKCTWNGYSLLTYAARHNLVEIAQLLLEAGADVNLPRSDGKKARDIALLLDHKNILSVLEGQKNK